MRPKLLVFVVSIVSLVGLTIYHSVTRSDNNFHVIFCNVGQGDGILLKIPKGKLMIVDGGPQENSMTECMSRHLPFWERTIDAVFLTHPDSDHLTGLIGVIRSYNVRYFGTSKAPKDTDVFEELMKSLREKKITIHYLTRGDRVHLKDKFIMDFLWPTEEFLNNPSEDTNDYSLVSIARFGKFTALLTGDVPSVYLNSVMPLMSQIDVFKPPHHGSKTGIDEFTFQHLVPKFAVISAGQKNKYGHPNKEVLNLLKSANIPYKTTFSGDVEIISDGTKWWVKN